jgi:hypothetical protein
MYTRRITTGAAAATLALLSTACSDQLTAPAAYSGTASFTAASEQQIELHPNSLRYSDTGAKPATGRSGSAAVDALALLGRDGYTDVQLQARAADPLNGATGTVTRALIKVHGDAGRVRRTHSVDGGAPVRLEGLASGTPIEVQANVTGIDAHRTDVVSVSQTVRKRPDLLVAAGAGNLAVYAGSPLVVGAHVTELNGELGARANCVLLQNGQPIDQARNIWVDAGSTVSCLFTVTGLTAGTHTFTVRADDVAPGDWNTDNNASSFTVDVEPQPAPMWAQVSVRSEQYRTRSYSSSYSEAGVVTERENEFTEQGARNQVSANGWIGRGYSAPAPFRLQEWANGQPLQDDVWTQPAFPSPVMCTQRYNQSQGTSLFFCSYFGTTSSWQFMRSSGRVAYHSSAHSRQWDPSTGAENVWHWSYDWTSGVGPAELIRDYRMQLTVTSADGATTVVDLPVNDMTPFSGEYENPEWCYEYGLPGLYGYSRECSGSESQSSGFSGFTYVSTD